MQTSPVGPDDDLRPVAPISLGEIVPGAPATGEPIVEWMDPCDLLVNGVYQRDLSPKSMALICTIISCWDWRRFKPPVVAWTERGFEIIDGQHTAIAAASHPSIDKIPVVVVDAAEQADRAKSFLGHNRDRLNVSAMQMHHAAVAAGDEDAQTIEQVCTRAGVALVRGAYGGRTWKPGETVAIASVKSLIGRRHAKGAREVLEEIARSGRAPIGAADIRAVEWLMTDPEYADQLEPGAIADAIRSTANADREAKVNAKMLCIPLWKGLAMAWFKRARKKRKAA